MNPYIEAGARVILRRALAEIDIVGETVRRLSTESLITLAQHWDAPVSLMADRWMMIAHGKPDITIAQSVLMIAQANRAMELWRVKKI